MHKFWARKPHNIVRHYIESYSRDGEIVLDPFCGSGVTPLEAMKQGRKAIAVDLDPIAACARNLEKLLKKARARKWFP
jgi:DNA modification methylase